MVPFNLKIHKKSIFGHKTACSKWFQFYTFFNIYILGGIQMSASCTKEIDISNFCIKLSIVIIPQLKCNRFDHIQVHANQNIFILIGPTTTVTTISNSSCNNNVKCL